MKVRIVNLDGSFGPLMIELEADTDDERNALTKLSEIPASSTFEMKKWKGRPDGSIGLVVLEQMAQKR